MLPLRDDNPRHGPAVVVGLLLAANTLVFVLMLGLDRFEALRVVARYGFVPALFFAAPLEQGYRLVSALFLHGGLGHLLGNMIFLWVFGDNVEDRLGHLRFALFYLLGGVVATLAHALLTTDSRLPLIGASGAISALLGAYLRLFPRQRILTLILPFFLLWLPAWLYLGYWGFIQLLQASGSLMATMRDSSVGEVAWWAHVGGFAFGFVAVPRFLKPAYRHP